MLEKSQCDNITKCDICTNTSRIGLDLTVAIAFLITMYYPSRGVAQVPHLHNAAFQGKYILYGGFGVTVDGEAVLD